MNAVETAELRTEQAWTRVMQLRRVPLLALLAMDAYAEACDERNNAVIARNKALGF